MISSLMELLGPAPLLVLAAIPLLLFVLYTAIVLYNGYPFALLARLYDLLALLIHLKRKGKECQQTDWTILTEWNKRCRASSSSPFMTQVLGPDESRTLTYSELDTVATKVAGAALTCLNDASVEPDADGKIVVAMMIDRKSVV